MKEFDAFENSIKESIGGFADTKPSKMLWVKINASLLFAFLLRKTSLIVGTLSLVTIASFGWIYSSNTSSNSLNTNIETNEQITKTTINSNKTNYNNSISNKTSSSTAKISNKKHTSINTTTNNKAISNSNEPKQELKTNSTNKASNAHSLEVEQTTIASTENKQAEKQGKQKNYSKNVGATYIAAAQTNSLVKQGVNKQPNNSSSYKNNSTEQVFSDYKVLKMSLINTSYKYNNEDFMKNPKYKTIDYRGTKLFTDYEIFMGPNLNYSMFELNPNNISDNELNKQSILPSYHFGGNFNLYYKDWLVRTGINYSTIDEQISYSTTSLNIDSRTYYYTIISNTYTWDTIGWNKNVSGTLDSIPIVSLGVQQTSSQNSITEYDSTISTQKLQYRNSYSSINIPLLIGRRFIFDRFTFDVATGISWSHITKFETHILDPISGEVIIANQENSNVKKDVFNGVLAIGAGYKLNGLNTLFIRPELQYNFNSIFDKTNFNKYKVLQMRLSVGLRYSIK